jgi:trk system potassium uptake protein
MNLRAVINIISLLIVLIGFSMLGATFAGKLAGDSTNQVFRFTECSLFTMLVGLIVFLKTRDSKLSLGLREGYAVVTLGWLAVAAVSAIPFPVITDGKVSFTDGFFEAMSGFTTTGSSILTDVEHGYCSKGLIFWRSLTNLLGGLGIVVMSMVLLPFLGTGGVQLFRAESTGTGGEQVTSRAVSTAKILWALYFAMTLICIASFKLLGMPWFDSFCHGMSAISTGGFSCLNSSFMTYGEKILWVAIIAQFISGTNYILHVKAIRGDWKCYWKDEEFRWYVGIYLVASLLIAQQLMLRGMVESGSSAITHATFQVVTIGTCCGFASMDFASWPESCKMILLMMMLLGACSGSTSGALKITRIILLAKYSWIKIKQVAHPRSIFSIHYNGSRVDNSLMHKVMVFTCLYIATWIAGAFLLSFVPGLSLEACLSGSLTCLSNVGPGLAQLGPTCNFEFLPDWATWVCSMLMLLGRLEIFTVMILLSPSLWRK